jgi:DNA-binding CsgD family transcriptional regulator
VAASGERRLVARLARTGEREWLLVLTEERPVFSAEMLGTLGLSRREAEVMRWIAEGKTNGEIATLLDIGVFTVNKHAQSIFLKLGVQSRQQATLAVLERLGSSMA